jgi:hypothetical protein
MFKLYLLTYTDDFSFLFCFNYETRAFKAKKLLSKNNYKAFAYDKAHSDAENE